MSSPNTVHTVALVFADAEERTTWGRPTFQGRDTIFLGLHDDLLILRGDCETQAAHLAQDSRLRPTPHWGRDGWIATALADVADEELSDLPSGQFLAGGTTR